MARYRILERQNEFCTEKFENVMKNSVEIAPEPTHLDSYIFSTFFEFSLSWGEPSLEVKNFTLACCLKNTFLIMKEVLNLPSRQPISVPSRGPFSVPSDCPPCNWAPILKTRYSIFSVLLKFQTFQVENFNFRHKRIVLFQVDKLLVVFF